MLAVHGLGKQGHMRIHGQSEHSMAHGEKLLQEIIYDDYHKAELAKEDPSRKRVRAEDIRSLLIMASPEQSTRFFEVQPDTADSSWRAGINLSCEDIDLQQAIVDLCSKELDTMDLAVRDQYGCKVLVTTKALKEGQRIGNISSLLFSTKPLMRDFLNKGGNQALMDAPLLEVRNLETSDPLDEAPDVLRRTSVFSIPVGVARLLVDHRHAKLKFPNVELYCSPDAGPNDGFIQARVKTHNLCGISAGKPLALDFGEDWQLCIAGTSDAAKRFKGTLDCFWGKASVDGLEADSDIPEPLRNKAASANAEPARKKLKVGAPADAPADSDNAEPARKKFKGCAQELMSQASANTPAQGQPSPDKNSKLAGIPSNTSTVNLMADEQMLGSHDGVTTLLTAKHVINLFCDSASPSGKRKLPPKTFLCEFSNGTVQGSDTGDDLQWAFTKTNTLVIFKDKGAQLVFRCVSPSSFICTGSGVLGSGPAVLGVIRGGGCHGGVSVYMNSGSGLHSAAVRGFDVFRSGCMIVERGRIFGASAPLVARGPLGEPSPPRCSPYDSHMIPK
jgi:hypothetical protein